VPFHLDPGLQEHATTDELDIGELEYAGQEEHIDMDVAPDTVEYVFTGQSVQFVNNIPANLPGTH
jgi:hypothetical protein